MLATGTYSYCFDEHPSIEVKVELRHRKLDVYLYVNNLFGEAAVRHFVDFRDDGVKVVDIYGARPGSRWHRQGLGALAVNTAVQFVKAIYPPTASVRGHVYDGQDHDLPEDERPKRQENRKAFWRTFGFAIAPPDSQGDEYFCGTIADLTVVAVGKTLGVHPRVFDISKMSFLPKDGNAL